jgi:hypothetical protein
LADRFSLTCSKDKSLLLKKLQDLRFGAFFLICQSRNKYWSGISKKWELTKSKVSKVSKVTFFSWQSLA